MQIKQILADSLLFFSLDVVGVITSYLACEIPQSGLHAKCVSKVTFLTLGLQTIVRDIVEGPDNRIWILRECDYTSVLFIVNHDMTIFEHYNYLLCKRLKSIVSVDGGKNLLSTNEAGQLIKQQTSNPLKHPVLSVRLPVIPYEMAVDPTSHHLFVLDDVAPNRVLKIAIDDPYRVVARRATGFHYPLLKINRSGEVHIFSLLHPDLKIYDNNLNLKRVLPELWIGCLGFDSASNLLISSHLAPGTIVVRTPQGHMITDFTVGTTLHSPQAIYCDDLNHIWIGDANGNVFVFGFVKDD